MLLEKYGITIITLIGISRVILIYGCIKSRLGTGDGFN